MQPGVGVDPWAAGLSLGLADENQGPTTRSDASPPEAGGIAARRQRRREAHLSDGQLAESCSRGCVSPHRRAGCDSAAELAGGLFATFERPPGLDPPGRAGVGPGRGVGRFALDELARAVSLQDDVVPLDRQTGRGSPREYLGDDPLELLDAALPAL